MAQSILHGQRVKTEDGYVLLISVRTMEGSFALYPAWSKDGYDFDIAPSPLLSPMREGQWSIYEGMGVRDARITPMDGTYYITYDAIGVHGECLALATTDDFQSALRLGIVAQPDNKAGALFPRKIDNKYVRLERPQGGSIWINFSEDLVFWESGEVVMSPRAGYWDASRIAAATPPFEIDQGWLFFYRGVKDTSAGPLSRIGAAILDKDNPRQLVARTNVPVLTPRMPYERVGDEPNMVYSCGAILEDDGEIKLYYGAADTCIAVGTTHLSTVVDTCMDSDREY